MKDEFEKLNHIISALLSTHTADVLTTDSSKSLAASFPYDSHRVELFTILYNVLKDYPFNLYPDINRTEESFRLFSFFESYFSNYIEGTKFTIEQAKQIVDTGIPIPKWISVKIIPNRAGQTEFVDPKLAEETLRFWFPPLFSITRANGKSHIYDVHV